MITVSIWCLTFFVNFRGIVVKLSFSPLFVVIAFLHVIFCHSFIVNFCLSHYSHFQREAKLKPFPVKMSFICARI